MLQGYGSSGGRVSRFAAMAALVALIGGAGCVASVAPRLNDDVATSLAHAPMRRLESADVLLYYPAFRRDEALRFLERAQMCVAALRARTFVRNGISTQKLVLLMPEVAFNNAFSAPRVAGYEAMAVVPTYNTIDHFWLEGGLPPDPPAIACHEIAHYVHMQQIAGFAAFLNGAFGQLYTPQVGLDSWFHEGLAVNYETRLQPGIGRLAWPFWQGVFAAGVSGRKLNGGDLHYANRDFSGGNNYLVGSYFVQFLIDRYGEEKLWKLIDVQARSVFFTLWVNVRFWQAYDKSLSTLLDEFAADVRRRYPVVGRPPEQRVLRHLGTDARYARAVDGTEALIERSHDRPTRLIVIAPDGRVRFERNLTDVLPLRTLKAAAPQLASGLSFTRDGRFLYFAMLDLDVTFQTVRLVRFDLATGQLRVVHDDLRGVGGSISPDGARYVFARAESDHHDLFELELGSGRLRTIAAQPHGHYVSTPRFSPDGRRILASRFDGKHFVLSVFDAEDGRIVADVSPGDRPVNDGSWVDDRRIVCLAPAKAGGGFQVMLVDVETGQVAQVTHAPYLAFEPQAPAGHALRFLNREGWQWTLDEVPLPELPAPPPQPAPAPEPPVTAPEPATEPAPSEPPATAPEPPVTAPEPPVTDGRGGHSGASLRSIYRHFAAYQAAPEDSSSVREQGSPSSQPAPAAAAPAPAAGYPSPPASLPPPAYQAPPGYPPTYGYPPPGYPPPPGYQAPPGYPPTYGYPPPGYPPPPGHQAPLAYPPPPGYPPPVPPLVLSDEEYRVSEHLFVPQMYALTLALSPGGYGLAMGATLGGADRLELHRWAISGFYEWNFGPAGLMLAYANRQLAPFTITAQGLYLELHDPTEAAVAQAKAEKRNLASSDMTLARREAVGVLDVSRSFWGNPAGIGMVFVQRKDDIDTTSGEVEPLELRRLAGPRAFASYAAAERTAYTGDRRSVVAELSAAVYPKAWSTLGSNLVDVSGLARAVVPLPLWRRHTFTLSLRGHALVGPPSTSRLLRVGGAGAGLLYGHSSDPVGHTVSANPAQPPQITFVESLRGYEDYPWLTDRVFIADATYRAPIIIDWGTASTFGLLPAFFLRQIDLRLFATGATDARRGDRHLVAGASLTTSIVFLAPMEVSYQIARRFDDDRALVHFIMLRL